MSPPPICPIARFTGRADEGKTRSNETPWQKQEQVSRSNGPPEAVDSAPASRRGRSPAAAAAPLGSLERARSVDGRLALTPFAVADAAESEQLG